MRSRSRLVRRFIAFFLGLAIAFTSLLFSPLPGYSANSVASCMAQPACAAALAGELGGSINTGFIAGGSSATYITGAAGMGVLTTAIYGANWLAGARLQARKEWADDHPQSLPTNATTGGQAIWPGKYDVHWTAYDGAQCAVSNVSYGITFGSVVPAPTRTGVAPPGCGGGYFYMPAPFPHITYKSYTLVPSVTDPPLPTWDGMSPSDRQAGIDSILPGDLVGGNGADIPAPDVDVPLTPDGTLTPNDPFITVPPGVLSPTGPIPGPTTVPNPDYAPALPTPGEVADPDTPGWYTTPTGTFYWDGSTWKRPHEAPFTPGDPLPTSNPAPSPSPSPSPSPESEDDTYNWNPPPAGEEDCPDCSEQDAMLLGHSNFVTYAGTKFSNKFPFDIVGTFDSSGLAACPVLDLWEYDQEFCEIRDFFGAMKYPVWFLFMLRMMFSV